MPRKQVARLRAKQSRAVPKIQFESLAPSFRLCYYLCGVWRDFFAVHRLTSQKSKKPIPLARLGFSHIGRGTIARGHDGHRRQFFPTQSNAPWRQASFVCSPRRTNSSGADQSAYVSEPNSNGQGELFLATFFSRIRPKCTPSGKSCFLACHLSTSLTVKSR